MHGLIKLWIIEKESGILIFEQVFEEIQIIDSDLISGFFVAMMSFAQETTNQEIEFIQLKQIRISFKLLYRFIFAIATEHDVEYEETEEFLKKIHERFESKYKNVLQQGFVGETSIFNNFAQDIEDVLGKKSKHFGFIQESAEVIKKYLDVAKGDWGNVKSAIKQKILNPRMDFQDPKIKIITLVKDKFENTVQDVKKAVETKIRKKLKISTEEDTIKLLDQQSEEKEKKDQ